MRKRIIVYAAVILTVINLTILGVLAYHQWVQAPVIRPGGGFDRVQAEIGLSPAQLDTLDQLRQRFHTELDSLRSLLVEERRLLAQEIRKPNPDTARMQQILDRIGQIQERSQWSIIRHFIQFKAIMTPEQEERFFDIVLERFVDQPRFPGRGQHPSSGPPSNQEACVFGWGN